MVRKGGALRGLVSFVTLVAGGLAACQGGGATQMAAAPGADPMRAPAPLALTRSSERPPSALMPYDEAAAGKAIANYSINKERERASYRIAGADLNGDGQAELLVLFDGKDWCATTGCSLAIFGPAERGYRPLFRTVRVKAPVVVSQSGNNGWRHLIVMTGGGPAPMRRVLLAFGADGYPKNAMLEPEVPPAATVEGETAIDAAAATAAAPRATR